MLLVKITICTTQKATRTPRISLQATPCLYRLAIRLLLMASLIRRWLYTLQCSTTTSPRAIIPRILTLTLILTLTRPDPMQT